jgi:hypothetical protein
MYEKKKPKVEEYISEQDAPRVRENIREGERDKVYV